MMKTCKDCIHRELCNVHGYIDADECGCFKDKSRYADAIKEFAERLKEKAKRGKGHLGNVYHSVEVNDIDNLVKEMVGDNNG